jgi:hypothetical protein
MRARGIIAAILGVIALAAGTPAAAQPTDIEVKAEFLPRFARYVTWPGAAMPRASEPFVLCILGADPFGGLVDKAARGQTVGGRRIVVKRLSAASGADACHLAFVAGSATRTTAQMLAGIGRKPVLTVTDDGGQRGIIHFSVAGGRVRFFIDQAAASERGLTISSRLLALAIGVKK